MSSNKSMVLENVSKTFSYNHALARGQQLMDRLKSGKLRTDAGHQYHQALRNISFELNRGDRLGIIGPNGSGKSTLLRIINQVMQPSSGRIQLFGSVGGLIEFSAGFQGNLTAYENTVINLTMLGMGYNKAKIIAHEVFKIADLEKFKYVDYKFYSSGMGVRLGFVTALLSRPDIVLLDEVMAVGDASFREKSLQMMLDYINGKTTVLVSHNMTDIETMCDRVVVLNKGEIVFDGDPAMAIDEYFQVQKCNTTISETIAPYKRRGATASPLLSVENLRVCCHGSSANTIPQGQTGIVTAKIIRHQCLNKSIHLHVGVKNVGGSGLALPVSGRTLTVGELPDDGAITFTFSTEALTPGEYVMETWAAYLDQPKTAVSRVDKVVFEVEGDVVSGLYGYVDLVIRWYGEPPPARLRDRYEREETMFT